MSDCINNKIIWYDVLVVCILLMTGFSLIEGTWTFTHERE